MSSNYKSRSPCAVLVVEDDRLTAELMRRTLEDAGYEARVAFTGSDGLWTARHLRPAGLICDLGLPGMSGWDIARALRRESSPDRIFMIAVSGYSHETDRLRSLESGFDRHLAKPVNLDELCRVLAEGMSPDWGTREALARESCMSDRISFSCPGCGRPLRASLRFVGRKCTCPNCDQELVISF
jgi:CheY-like chemotaxis protein